MTTMRIQYPPEIEEARGKGTLIIREPGEQTCDCPNCGGDGIIYAYLVKAGPFRQPPSTAKSHWMDLDGQTGWWTGETIAGFCPVCRPGHLAQYLERICGLEGEDLTTSLENFRTAGPLAAKAEALTLARGFMAMNGTPSGFVTLLGDRETSHGVGKSHLAKGMVNGFRQIGVWSRYTTLADLLAELHERFGKNERVKTEELVERYRTVRVLAIDEIDKAELHGWDRQTFFRLIDARERAQNELLTILIANAYVEEQRLWIWTYDQWGRQIPEAWPADLAYLQSRILGGVIVTVPGPDYRQMQGIARSQEALAAAEALPEPEEA